jgi:HNH endonuclease
MNKAEKIAVQEWVALHRCCAVCWWPESDLRRRLEVHHLVGGAGRKHDIRNYLSLCERCHGILHSGKVYSGLPDVDRRILLTAKQESDPENYDPAFLASLKHKKHLGYDPEPIPEYYLEERQRNVAGWKYRKP